MNPDIEHAVYELARRGIVPREKALMMTRVARGELVSVHSEIRLLYYLGVLAATGGAGLLVAEKYQQVGPAAVAIGILSVALACFAWAEWKSPPFSRRQVPSPTTGFDYVILLGVLLSAAALAFIELQFTPAGDRWPWHLLVVSMFMAFIAFRYDSRTVFSLALSTFGAWRGVSVSLIEGFFWRFSGESVRWNTLACGLLFIGLGRLLARYNLKAHFHPVALNLGWILILGALASGGLIHGKTGVIYIAALTLTGTGMALRNLKQSRFALFSYGIAALYLALNEIVLKAQVDFALKLFVIGAASVALIAVLWKIHGNMRVAP